MPYLSWSQIHDQEFEMTDLVEENADLRKENEALRAALNRAMATEDTMPPSMPPQST